MDDGLHGRRPCFRAHRQPSISGALMPDPLLVLSQCLPYPPHSGVANRTFNILVQLQRAFDVHLVAFSRRNHQPDAAARAASAAGLANYLTRVYEPAPLPGEVSPLARISSHLRSVATSRPYTLYDYRSATFARSLHEATAAVNPVLVHMDSLDLYGWMRRLPKAPVAVTHHSVESDLLRSRARHVSSAPVATYLRHQARLVEAVERKVCPRLPLNVVMSDADGDKLRAVAPGSKTVTVPNGVDTDFFTPRPEAPTADTLLFLGPTYMYPNRDAVDWFLETMWRTVRASLPQAQLHLVGKNPPADRARYEMVEGIRCHGYVPDIRPHLAAVSCSIVPIRVGGGTRLKILDSWAMGTAVVSTSTGCEGLATADGENILIRDRPEEFAAAVIQVLRSAALRTQLGAAGRATAERLYSWRVIGDQIIEAYRGLTYAPLPSR
jgi:glycosyltransferase involved in cell wall biosynthesis